jgi:hypothetical protein
LDQAFLKIVGSLPKDINLSEFLKNAVVENESLKSGLLKEDQILKEVDALLETASILSLKIKNLDFQNLSPEKAVKLQKVLNILNQVVEDIDESGC